MLFSRSFYEPKPDAIEQKIERPDLKATVYMLKERNPGQIGLFNRIEAMGFSGKRAKYDFHYRFPTLEKRNQYIESYFQALENRRKSKQESLLQKEKWKLEFLAQLKPGVILYDTWGYDQTNVEFYKVLAVKGSQVTIQELTTKSLEATGWASDRVVAGDETHGPILKKQVRGSSIKISDCISLRIWDGKDLHRSWYA